jgi:hypothetical protein
MMMMRLIYQRAFNSAKPDKASILFNQSELVIRIKADGRLDSWKYAATVSRFIDHPSNPTFLESWELGFDKKLICLPKLNIPYQLAINPAKWLGNYTLSIWESMPLYTDPSGALISSTAAPTTVAAVTASAVILAANPDRKGASIRNNSTGTLSLEFGATAVAATAAIKLAAGALYEVPYDYVGVISGIWTNTNGNALVREFS